VLALVLHASPCRHRPEKGALARNRTALQGVLGASGERVTAGPETLPSAQGSAGHAGELGQRRPGLLAAADTGGTVEPATREIGSGDRRGRSNRDRRHPLHFSQRLQALSAEWTPALYLAVPIPVFAAPIFDSSGSPNLGRGNLARAGPARYASPSRSARQLATAILGLCHEAHASWALELPRKHPRDRRGQGSSSGGECELGG